MAVKKPWRKHFTKDWANDPFVRSLELEPRMFFLELLDIAWDEGGLRSEWLDGAFISNRIGVSRRKFVTLWARVRVKFEEFSPGIWSNLRLELERIESEKDSEKHARAAKARWEKVKDAFLSHRSCNASEMPSESESESESESDKRPYESPTGSRDPGFKLEAQKPQKPKVAKPKKQPTPMPFTIAQGFEALESKSQGRFITGNFDPSLAKRVTDVIRHTAVLADWELVGRWMAGTWPQDITIGPGWIATAGKLTDAISKARAWQRSGSQKITRLHGTPLVQGRPQPPPAEDLIAKMKEWNQ